MKTDKNFFADSSLLVDLFRGESEAIKLVEEASSVITSVLCKYELEKQARFDREKLERNRIVELGERDVERAAEIYRSLQESGEMINQIDILIAAQAINRDFMVATRDRDFKRIDDLEVRFYRE